MVIEGFALLDWELLKASVEFPVEFYLNERELRTKYPSSKYKFKYPIVVWWWKDNTCPHKLYRLFRYRPNCSLRVDGQTFQGPVTYAAWLVVTKSHTKCRHCLRAAQTFTLASAEKNVGV